MSKLKSADWWLGRTPEWQARQDAVRSAGEGMQNAGRSITTLMLAVVGTVLAVVFAFGIPLVFAVASAWIAPSRGRSRIPAYTLGLWLPAIYLLYLATREKA